jgi:putative membrane protein insertion efficiency factor
VTLVATVAAPAPNAAPQLAPTEPAPTASSPSRPGPLARLFIAFIRVYQMVGRGRPSPCRYLPTCSEYAAIALHRHGAARGSWLTARRLCRCHPWGGFGADPVPEPLGVRNPS